MYKSITTRHTRHVPAPGECSDLVFNLDPRALAATALGDGRDLNVVGGRPSRGRQGRPELELLVLIERGLWQAAVHCCVRNRRDLAKHLVRHAPLCTAGKQQAGQNCPSLRQGQGPAREARAWSTVARAGAPSWWAPLMEVGSWEAVTRTVSTMSLCSANKHKTAHTHLAGLGSRVCHKSRGHGRAGEAIILVQMQDSAVLANNFKKVRQNAK